MKPKNAPLLSFLFYFNPVCTIEISKKFLLLTNRSLYWRNPLLR